MRGVITEDDRSRAKVFKDTIRRAVYKASPLPSAPDEASIDQRINCYKEIAKYTYPRLKLQELWVSPIENSAPTVIKLVAGKS